MKKGKTKERVKNKKENAKNNVSRNIVIKRIILLVLIILWAVFVFGFSSQTGNESSGLSRKIAELFFETEKTLAIAEPIIRKLAHFLEYALGGLLIYFLADTYEYSKKIKILVSMFLGIWYATIDEIHQTFVPDRSGNVLDVFLDALGIFFGICIALLYLKIKTIIINKNKTNKKDENKDVQLN